MRSNSVLYKKTIIMLLLSSFMLCGCSSEKEIESEHKTSQEVVYDVQQESEKMQTIETEDILEAVITEVNWENYFDGINGSAVIHLRIVIKYIIRKWLLLSGLPVLHLRLFLHSLHWKIRL